MWDGGSNLLSSLGIEVALVNLFNDILFVDSFRFFQLFCDIILVPLFRYMMAKQGLKSLFPMEDIVVMGIWELLPHLNKFRVSTEQEQYIFVLPHIQTNASF